MNPLIKTCSLISTPQHHIKFKFETDTQMTQYQLRCVATHQIILHNKLYCIIFHKHHTSVLYPQCI